MQTSEPKVNGQAIAPESLEALKASFSGELIDHQNPQYPQQRPLWNGMIDKKPALIARCTGVSDVIQAVKFAREHNLLTAVRGGGHNVAGNAMNDGGLVIDLSMM